MGAHSTGCRPTHQPYIRRPDQHHPVLNTAIKLISMLPGASIENVKISLPQVIGLYAIILLIYALWRRIDKQKSSECKIP